ncbi:MAG TPA: PBP1A family penicillin-binding protein [Longimicrobiales bacterium]|nr:PBP1A family penicillin-binding protein [Longimicrobiales bacterium]
MANSRKKKVARERPLRARLPRLPSLPRRRVLQGILALLVAGTLGLTLFLFLPAVSCDGPACPSVDALRTYEPPQASRVFAMDGALLADLSPQRRVVVDLEEISPLLREGVLAVEDRRFWSHHGVDLLGIGRAVLRNAGSMSWSQGFSTVDMQLARSVFPEALPLSWKLRRKVWEVLLALEMERKLTKEQILALYLNQIYMGGGLYGMEAAAQGYLGKSAAQVTPAEAALLVAIVKTPERYNPRRHPERALERRNLVLGVMLRQGVIGPEEHARARTAPLRLAPPYESAGPAPWFVAAVRGELRERFGPDADIRGLRVFTGLDPALQRAAQRALERRIEAIEGGDNGRWPHATPDGALAASPGSSPYLQGMVVALDPHSGEVRALVGGRDFAHSQFDRALQAKRQPGSAFKPIVYAAALERGLPTTARISTVALEVENAGSPTWRPSDHVADSALSVRDAVALSSNTAAVRVGQWVGEERVIAMARGLGISADMKPYPSLHLGAADVAPVELVAAYAAFANGGLRVEPRLVTRVEDANGAVVWRAPARRERVLSEGVAYLTLSLLEDVVDRGTAGVVRRSGFWLPAAGKTGTTNDEKDAWFVGMTPDVVAGVWLGFDEPRTILRGQGGGSLAAPAWADMMKQLYAERPAPGAWTAPASLVSLPVDLRSGAAATSACPPEDVRIEYYLPGTEPQTWCPLHPDGAGQFLDRLWRRMRKIF